MANVTVEMTGEEYKLLRAFGKVIEKQRELGRRAEETGKKSKRASDTAHAGTQKWIGSVAALGGGYLSLRAVIGQVTRAVKELDQAREAAAQRGQQRQSAAGRLAQLARTPVEYRRLIQGARQTYREGRVGSWEEAVALTYELQSGGAFPERRFFSQMAGITDVSALVGGAATTRKAFGVEEAGTFRQLASKALAAAAPAPRVGAADIMTGVSRAAVSARRLGLSDEEVFAAVSLLAQATGSGEEAGTLLGRMFQTFRKRGLEAGTLQQYLGKAQATMAGMTQAEMIKWFGRERGERAYGLLTGPGVDVGARIAAVRRAQAEDLAGQKLRMFEGTPEYMAAIRARGAAAAEELAGMEKGRRRNIANEVVRRRTAFAEAEGAEARAWLLRRRYAAQRLFPGGERGLVLEEGTPEERRAYLGEEEWAVREMGATRKRIQEVERRMEWVRERFGPGMKLEAPLAEEREQLMETLQEQTEVLREIRGNTRGRATLAPANQDPGSKLQP